MKAVIDTNVLINAVFRGTGPPYAIVDAWGRDAFELVTSAPLLSEFEGVLQRPWIRSRLGLSDSQLSRLVERLRNASVVEPSHQLAVLRDEADKRILEAAVAGEADYIVTGDRALLEVETFEGVAIVTPARFAAILAGTVL